MIEKLIPQNDNEYKWVDDTTGCSYKSKTEYLISGVLKFCGCGDPESVLIYIKDTLLTINNENWYKNNEISYKFFLYWADSCNLSEHGVSVNCSWLTKKGEELINDINWCIENEKEEFE